MKVTKFTISLIGFLFLSFVSISQEDNSWKIFPGIDAVEDESEDSLIIKIDSLKDAKASNTNMLIDTNLRLEKLTKTGKTGTVTVKADERVDKISKKMGTPCKNCPNVKIRGYRVQIQNNTKKTKIDESRNTLVSVDNETPTYIDYKAPYFRLRAGDFRTRLEAERFKDKIKDIFPGAVVIEDMIELPTIEE